MYYEGGKMVLLQPTRLVVALLVALLVVAPAAGVVVADHDGYEPNDGFDSAASVDEGSYTNLHVADGESDYYAIDLAAGEELTVDVFFTHADGDLDLTVYDPDRNEIDQSVSVNDGERVTVTADEAGTYYVEVYGFSGASNSYDLELSMADGMEPDEFEPNDHFAEAAPVDGGFYSDLTVVDGESDYYAVDLTAGEELTVDVFFTHADGDLDLTVYDPDRNEIDHSVSVNDGERVTVTADESGTYYVEVYGFSGASNGYDVELSMADGTEPDEFEPNDHFAEAAPVEDELYQDLTVVDGESDYYAIDLTVDEELTVDVLFSHDEGDLDVSVYDPDRNEIDHSVSVNDGERVTVTADEAGTYYLEVYGFSGASNGYDLGLERSGGVTPTETPTDTPTRTTADTRTSTPDDGTQGATTDGGGGDGDDVSVEVTPGFEVSTALVALLAVLAVLGRR